MYLRFLLDFTCRIQKSSFSPEAFLLFVDLWQSFVRRFCLYMYNDAIVPGDVVPYETWL